MRPHPLYCTLVALALLPAPLLADEAALKAALAREIISPRQTLLELQDHVEARLPTLPTAKTAAEWEALAARLREDVLARAVLRGEGKTWSKAKTAIEYLDTIAGGEGYKIRKLRYEAVPGMWIPALLYVPDTLAAKTPVMLAVNGHDAKGKAAVYKQIRCINLAKRGLLVLNVEWFGMGQLRQAGNRHGCMNQLDLCGTSGMAPFYLAMTRGLDVLLAQPNADPARVAVSGLSGGGWQTIVVSALDTRVTLANPVAGYSSFRIRLRDHFKDLGDSEQTPVDLATVADYTHLTALRAPRPTLLTYNAKDECCFEAGYALPPLLDATRPVFQLFGKESALRSHVNHDPGTHNFEKENREVLYRMIGDHFYPGDKTFDANEILCDKEVKTAEALEVELPKDNATFNSLAAKLAKDLPRADPKPRSRLQEILKSVDLKWEETQLEKKDGASAIHWRLRLGKTWSVPVVEFVPEKPTKTAVVISDAGRRAEVAQVQRLLAEGYRVLAVDLFYFGEARIQSKDWLFALLVSTVGDRPLGIQASQLAAVARWAKDKRGQAVEVFAMGPRQSLIALAAAGIEDKAIGGLQLHGARESLKSIVTDNLTVDQMPEAFCFGLLEAFDVKQLAALAAPRPVAFHARKK